MDTPIDLLAESEVALVHLGLLKYDDSQSLVANELSEVYPRSVLCHLEDLGAYLNLASRSQLSDREPCGDVQRRLDQRLVSVAGGGVSGVFHSPWILSRFHFPEFHPPELGPCCAAFRLVPVVLVPLPCSLAQVEWIPWYQAVTQRSISCGFKDLDRVHFSVAIQVKTLDDSGPFVLSTVAP